MRPPRLPRAPDAAAMVGALKRSGMTQVQIARAVQVQASSVTRWLCRESVPSFRAGAALLTLVQQRAPAALSPKGFELVTLLALVIVCTLDVSNVIVCVLAARAID